MKHYELMVIVDPEIGSDAVNSKLEEIKQLIASNKGDIFFEDLWGVKDLAYRIKKKDKGYYAVFNMNMENDGIKEINTTLNIDGHVLRHLLVKMPEGYEPKSKEDIEKEIEQAKKEAKIDEVVEEKKKAAKSKTTAAPKNEEAKEELKAEKTEKVEKEEAAEPEKKETAKKEDESKKSLEDVDKKLSNLLDNPDLNF